MVTLKDLAKELGVSVSTVSKALSNSYEISEKTKQKVLELAKKRNYTPNNIAVNLRKRETKTIGVLIPNIFNYFYTKILSGIESEAKRNGYKTIVSISNETLQSEKEGLEFFSNGSVDGILFAPSDETEKRKEIQHFLDLKEKQIPSVLFDRYMDHLPVDKVIVNDFESSKNAVEYFIKSGRKNIIVVSLLKNLTIGGLRKQGAFLNDHIQLLEFDDESLLQKSLYDVIEKGKVDAIFAIDEPSGIIALNTVREKQLKIPEEVAIISFSQGILSKYSYPKLSTINQHAQEIGIASVELLLKRIKNEDKEIETRTIITSLELNQTT